MGARPSHFTLTQDGPLRLYSTAELLAMDPPEWLIDGVFPENGLIGVYGQPGMGKSFVTLDFALSIASGTPWQGRQVKKGFVIYISAEGGRGIGKRVLAWLAAHDLDMKDVEIAWLVEAMPVNVDSEEMTILLERLAKEVRQHPTLIVVDTLARCFDGDENLQVDMGRFIAGVDFMRHEFGCAVIVVHHTNLSGQRERGNTAFRGACDTMMQIEKDGPLITVTCTKQKDDEEFDPVELELRAVDGTQSCAVVGSHAVSRQSEMVSTIVGVLAKVGPCSWDVWISELAKVGIERGVWFKYRKHLEAAGVTKKGKNWQVAEAQVTGVGG